MAKTMKEKVEMVAEDIDYRIEWKEEDLRKELEELKRVTAEIKLDNLNAAAHDTEMLIGKIRMIQEDAERIRGMYEEKKHLEFILKEEEEK